MRTGTRSSTGSCSSNSSTRPSPAVRASPTPSPTWTRPMGPPTSGTGRRRPGSPRWVRGGPRRYLTAGGRPAGPARCPLSRCEERPPRLAAALRGGASGGGSFPPWRAEVSPRKGENEEQLVLGLFATEVSGLSGFGQIDVCCEVSVVLKRSFLQAKPRQLALSPSVTLPAAFRSFVAKSCRLAFLLGCESLELLGPGMKSRLYLWILTNRCCL